MISTVTEWEVPFKAWLKVHYHPSTEHKVPVTSVYKRVVETFGTQIAIAGMGRIVKATFPSVRRMCMGKRGTKGYFYYGLKEKGNSETNADSDNPDAPIDVGDMEYDEQDMKIASNGNSASDGLRINGNYNHGQSQLVKSPVASNGMVSMNYAPINEHSGAPMDLSRGGLPHMRKDSMSNKGISENNNRLSPNYGKDREMAAAAAAVGNENAPPPVQKERERSQSALPPKKQIADRVAISQASELAAANTFRGSSSPSQQQRPSHLNGGPANTETAATATSSSRRPAGGSAPSFQSIIEQAIDRSFAHEDEEESETTATENNSDESNSSGTQDHTSNGNQESPKAPIAAEAPAAAEYKASSPNQAAEPTQNMPVSMAQTVGGHRVNFHHINSLVGNKLAEMNARLAEQARLGMQAAALNPQFLQQHAAAMAAANESRVVAESAANAKPDSRPSSRSSTDSSSGKRKAQARSPGQGRKKSKTSTSSPPEGEISQQSQPESRPSSRSSASSGGAHAQSGSESPPAMPVMHHNHQMTTHPQQQQQQQQQHQQQQQQQQQQQPNYESSTALLHPTTGAENIGTSPPRPEVSMANPMFSAAVRFPPNLPADFPLRVAQEPMFQRDCNCTSGLAARQLKSRVIGLEVEIDLMRHQNEHLKYLLIRERGEKDILVDRLQELERKLEQQSSSSR